MADKTGGNRAGMEGDVTALQEQVKTLFKQLDDQKDMLDAVHVIAQQLAVQGEGIKHMGNALAAIDKRVETLEHVPRKRWDAIVAAVIAALVGGGLGALLARLG